MGNCKGTMCTRVFINNHLDRINETMSYITKKGLGWLKEHTILSLFSISLRWPLMVSHASLGIGLGWPSVSFSTLYPNHRVSNCRVSTFYPKSHLHPRIGECRPSIPITCACDVQQFLLGSMSSLLEKG
jgi:hypothetical protein